MNPIPTFESVADACKPAVDCNMRVVEALVEGATRIHELQLQAATEAHAGAVATQKTVAQTADPGKIAQLYGEWMIANAQKSVAYWQSIAQVVMETNAAILKCFGEGASAVPVAGLDDAYTRWAKATRDFYTTAATLPAVPRAEKAKA